MEKIKLSEKQASTLIFNNQLICIWILAETPPPWQRVLIVEGFIKINQLGFSN